MGTRAEIVWSPTFRDQFMVIDNEMKLYKLDRYGVGEPVTTSSLTHWVSNSSTATRLSTNRHLSHHKCFDWHPRYTEFGQDLVAIGFANGRVLITSPSSATSSASSTTMGQSISNALGGGGGGGILVDGIGESTTATATNSMMANLAISTGSTTNNQFGADHLYNNNNMEDLGMTTNGMRMLGKEFVPKHSRSCQCVSWNPSHSNLLAIGLERHRSDNGVFIWDIHSRSPSSATPVPYDSAASVVSGHHHHHHSQPSAQQFETSSQMSLSSLSQQQQQPIIVHTRSHSGLADPLMSGYGGGYHQSVSTTMSTGSGVSSQQQQPQQQHQHTRALYEFGGGESAHSLAWQRQSPKCLVCGLSGKHIRLYDTRDVSKVQLQIATKAVYGLTIDPFSDQRVCSFVDSQLFLWDLRHTEKPLLVVTEQKPEQKSLAKVQWDPVRRNVFSSLCKDSAIIKIYHLQQITEETELSFTENHVQPSLLYVDETSSGGGGASGNTITSYDWHPSEECHLLSINSHGSISDCLVNERLCVQWSSDSGRLLTTFGKLIAELKNFHVGGGGDDATPILGGEKEEEMHQQEEDISTIMHRRANLGYGISGESVVDKDGSKFLRHNAELCLADGGAHSTALAWTWVWMDKLRQIAEMEHVDSWPYDTSFPGIFQVLRVGFGAKGNASSIEYRSMAGLDAAPGHTSMFRVYVSPERDRIIQFCGWGNLHMSSRDRTFSIGGGEVFFQDLLDGRQAERAAAIALFTLKLRMAVQILTKAANSYEATTNHYLQLTALALAGYPGSPSDREQNSSASVVNVISQTTSLTLNQSSSAIQSSMVGSIVSPTSLWFEQCNTILPKLSNPYLKAMFQFLACRAAGSNHFDALLESNELPLHDKLAFAAIFATDQRLEELVDSLTRECVDHGDLHGLILTGLGTEESLELIQRYVDRTGDVQTAALLIIHSGGVSSTGGDVTPSSAASVGASGSIASSAPPAVRESTNVINRIVDGYFSLLDIWGLWHVRAQTNAIYLKRTQPVSTGKIAPQVYITCTYCARSIWAGGGVRMRQRMHKLGSCPSCKKPLPRCALCRLNVGMPLASDQDSSKPNKFASWFAWCQSCRHGGHAQHLSDWFSTNNECPVTGCTCKCATLDSSSDFGQLLNTLMKSDA